MKRFILPCLIVALFFLPACREQSKEAVLQQGVEFAKAGNYQGAISLFKDALEKDPNYMDARMQLGLAYFELGKLDFAEKELEKAQRQDPANRDISLKLAHVYMATARLDKSLSELSKLETISPQDPEILSALAQCYAAKGDSAASEDKYRKALQFKPGDIEIRLGLARLLFSTQRIDAGEQLLQSVIADNPGKTSPYYLQLQLCLQRGDRNCAVSTLQRICEIDSNDLNAAYLLGVFYLDVGDVKAGRKVASSIKSKRPDHPATIRIEALADFMEGKYDQALGGLQKSTVAMQDMAGYYYTGLNYYQLKQYEQAVSSFQKALDLVPDHEQSRLMLAQTFLRQGRIDDCIRTARLAIGKNSRSALAYNILGSAYLAQGKYDQAMSELEKAIEIDPALAEVHAKKGLFNLASGNIKEGELDLRNAVAAAPDILNTRLLLASYYLKVQDYPKAIKTMQEGLSDAPDSAILYNNIAGAYFAQKKVTEALAMLEKAKAVKADYLAPYFNLANYHVSRQDYPAAIREYRQALQAVPNNVQASIKLAGLYELTGDTRQAEETYRKAAGTQEAVGYLALAAYLARSGKIAEAPEILKNGVTTHPEDTMLLKAQGAMLQSTGQLEEALRIYTQLEKVTPGQGAPLQIAVHLQQGNYAAAGEVAARIIAERPDAEFGYLLQSAINEHRKDLPAAEENLKRGIAACKQDFALRMKLAAIYAAQGKSAQAQQVYDEILQQQPKFVPALFAKGALLDAQGNKRKAEELYQATLALDNDYAPALNNLAYLQMDVHGNHKEALQLAVRAFRAMPEEAAVLDTLGYALLKNGQAEKAVTFLEKAARLRPNDATIKTHLEQAQKAAGKTAG